MFPDTNVQNVDIWQHGSGLNVRIVTESGYRKARKNTKMPYLIKGAVPTRAVGKCPWCEKEKAVLHLMACYVDGQLGCEYVCAKCMLALDEITEQNAKDGKIILRGNPAIEIKEDNNGGKT